MTRRPATEAPADSLPIDTIKVGKRRRQHMGDIDALAASIEEFGLLHPVVVTPERLLIAGERRLVAVKRLGWATVPVTVVPIRDLLGAEVAENRDRLNLRPTEAVAAADDLEPVVAAAAKERQRAAGGLPGSGKLPQPGPKSRDVVAKAVGMSARTLEKAAAVVAAVEADPDLAPIAEQMDESGNVDRAFRAVQKAQPAGPDHAAIMATAPVDERAERAYRWNRRLADASETLLRLGYTPTLDMSAGAIVPTLNAEERQSTETYVALMEDWLANARHVLRDTGALHVVGGRG